MPSTRRFVQVDVFAETPYFGNALAVVLDAQGLSDASMQQFARWTNLSETTFLLPPASPDADYRVRIFTPGGELPFAGHPTLGSAHAWLEAGGVPKDAEYVVQECPAGLVRVKRDGTRLAFAAPPTVKQGPLEEDYLDRVIEALGVESASVVDHQWVDNGPGWAVLRLESADEVLALEPDLSRIPEAMVGVIGAYPDGAEHAFEMRTFAPAVGVAEDPVCGSMNASVAQWLVRIGDVSGPYAVAQGSRVGRAGAIHLAPDGEVIWVGGHCTTCITGVVDL